MPRPGISVLINTCNEAALLPNCLESIQGWADEIVVCDMESTDDSVAIAQAAGAIVWSVSRRPAAEPEARIFGIEKCTGDWIFILDPDMRLSPDLKRRLTEITLEDAVDMVDMYCLNFYFTRWSKRGQGSQPVFRKFFRKSSFSPVPTNIQTFWHDCLKGRVISLSRQYSILHYGHPSIEGMVDRLVRYSRKEAEDYYKLGRRFRSRDIIWRPLKRFIGNYFIRGAILDGMPGLVSCVLISWYLFMIEAYIWELSIHGASAAFPDKPQ